MFIKLVYFILTDILPGIYLLITCLNMHITKRYTVGQKKKKEHPYLFPYKLPYRNETGTNHHGLLSTSNRCLKIFLRGPSTWGVST